MQYQQDWIISSILLQPRLSLESSFLNTYYTIDDEELRIKEADYNYKVNIQDIKRIEKSNSLLSSVVYPDRIEIYNVNRFSNYFSKNREWVCGGFIESE
jgi:hypothetical protein